MRLRDLSESFWAVEKLRKADHYGESSDWAGKSRDNKLISVLAEEIAKEVARPTSERGFVSLPPNSCGVAPNTRQRRDAYGGRSSQPDRISSRAPSGRGGEHVYSSTEAV